MAFNIVIPGPNGTAASLTKEQVELAQPVLLDVANRKIKPACTLELLSASKPAVSIADELREAVEYAIGYIEGHDKLGHSKADVAVLESFLAASPAAPAQSGEPVLPAWFDAFLTNVCELPDRNSPEDEPEAIVATLEELKSCALSAIESAVTQPAQTAQSAVVLDDERAAFEHYLSLNASGRYKDTSVTEYGTYKQEVVDTAWRFWQARAASPQPFNEKAERPAFLAWVDAYIAEHGQNPAPEDVWMARAALQAEPKS